MSRSRLDALLDHLGERDLAVLADVEKYRLLTTQQIQRLHFAEHHRTSTAGLRACGRVLARLRDHDLLRCLERRIGGVRRGSAGYIWYLGPAGERLLRHQRGRTHRRRYSEPSRHFVNHTLTVADLAIRLIEGSRAGAFEILTLQTEPGNWQQYLSPTGAPQWLKPDLYAITAAGDFEDHWYIEADLDTEHLPVVLKQCAAYQAYLASGRHQAAHGVFPVVLWVAPTAARARAITAAIASQATLNPNVFRVCVAGEFEAEFTSAQRK